MEQHQLRELEAMCIQEALPPCTTACPIHVDVRAMILEMRRGNFPAALKIVRKVLPFPGIVGRVCEAPCQEVCRRAEAGEAVAIAALERACADLGGSADKVALLPGRSSRVAIVGGGPSGLIAAYDLRKKGYGVVLFEAQDHLGGRLWDIVEHRLPRQVIRDELAVLEAMGVQVRLGSPLGHEALPALCAEFQAVYMAVGAESPDTFGLDLDGQGQIRVDPFTYSSSQEGVFAGGSLLRRGAQRSLIQALSDGRRAATSVDRFLQKASLTAARQNEGSYPSQLYTNTQGIEPLPAVVMADPLAGYSREEAMQEASRCFPCNCLECVKVCEYLAHYRSYPKKYVREIYNNLSIVTGNRLANQFINSCSLCGLCAEVCPTHLSMAVLCQQARRIMVAQKKMPPSAHDFALRDMQFSTGDKFALTRNQPGTTASDYVFFPGCQLSASAPEQVEQVYGHLRATLPGRVGLMLGCCGAPAEWAGRDDLLQEVLAELMANYRQLGSPIAILACSTCYQVFKMHLPDVQVLSLWEILATYGLPASTAGAIGSANCVLAIHDPCTTRHEPQIQDSVRKILAQIGYQVEELPLNRAKTECCSYGGLMWLANPDLAKDVVRRRIEASAADFVTYCAVCRDFFASCGKRTLHLLDLVYGQDSDARAQRSSPGWSQRHENRTRLKRRLLTEVWGEEMPGQQTYEAIRLLISAEVQKLMEKRLILVEDVQQVIEHAERTGAGFLNRDNGHLLAGYKPASVTYWVEYTPATDPSLCSGCRADAGEESGRGFVVHNAYSHRMEIEKSGQR